MKCESCSMTIESGVYCEYCSDGAGGLMPFEEIVERFNQWTRRRNPNVSDEDARARTLEFMSSMPAWRDHPEVRRAAGGDIE